MFFDKALGLAPVAFANTLAASMVLFFLGVSMRFYMIYSNQFAVGNKPLGISSLSAVLKAKGHQFKLMDCTQFILSHEDVPDRNRVGEITLEFKPPRNPERLPSREPMTFRSLCERIIQDIDTFKPEVVGLSALTDDYPLGINILRRIRSTFPNIPFIVGGIHATVDPTGVIRETCVDAICIGEGEETIVEIAERVDKKESLETVRNLWVKKPDGSIVKNHVRPLLHDLDNTLPFPDWSIWSENAFYKPYMGEVYMYGDFEMSRGCPFTCSYCINVGLQQIYKLQDEPSRYHREKSIDRVIAEVKWAMDTHGIEFLKFWDETFLLMSPQRLEEFHEKYRAHCNIPYVIETTAGSCMPHKVKILQDTNCRSASLGMETGSPDLRKGVLNKPTENKTYIEAFKRLKQHGIRPVSFNMLGLPGETKRDVFRTVLMNRLCGTESQSLGIFYPYKGTPIRSFIQSRGQMSDDFEYTELQKDHFTTFTAGRVSVMKFTDMDGEELLLIKDTFSLYVHLPFELYAMIDYCRTEKGEFAELLLLNLRRALYQLRFQEDPASYLSTQKLHKEYLYSEAGSDSELLNEPLVVAFKSRYPSVYSTLVENWFGNEFFEEFSQLLLKTLRREILPEIEFDESSYETELVQVSDESGLETIRAEIRDRAKSEALEFVGKASTAS